MCYRYEQSGELSGLLRVRALAINDAHIYCTPEQTKAEFVQVMQMHMDYYRLFGISDYWVRLSLPDLDEAGKYLDQPERWQQAMEIITTSMQEVEFPYEAVPGEAAFYGPKVDMQIQNVVGREETASTNQLDVMMAERFDLTYVGPDNRPHHPNIIHRAPLGSHERFIAFLVEHYGGIFPTWLAPEQVRIVPVAPAFLDYAHTLEQALRQQLVRVRVDDSQESFGKKIRNGVTDKVPNLFIIGQKEQDDEAVSWRRHGSKDQQTLRFDAAKNSLLEEIRERRDWRRNSA
jgi:threonyl-tRNA synthetase